MLQTRLAAAAETLQRHILANQPFSVRCAAALLKIARSDKELFTRVVAAHFLLREVRGMKMVPLEDNEPVLRLIEKYKGSTGTDLNKGMTLLAARLPRGYFWDEADRIYKGVFKIVQDVAKGTHPKTLDRVFADSLGQALVNLQRKPAEQGAALNRAAVYVRTIMVNAMIDTLRAESRTKEVSLTTDEGAEHEVEIDSTQDLERAVEALPSFERQKFIKDLLSAAWMTEIAQDQGDQLVAMAIEGHSQRAIAKELDLSVGTVNEWWKRWLPHANKIVDRYLAA